jgi:fused signal recognition particle receptor
MGSFNWFNRKFNDKPSSDNQESQDSPQENQPVEAAEAASAEPETDESASVNENYLSWAKAAYANIRKRQEETTAPPEPSAASTAEAPAAETQVGTEPQAEQPEATVEIPEITPLAVNTSSVAATVESAEPATEPTVDAAPAETAAAPSALPFWAQAEAERLERLERLKLEAEAAEAAQAAETIAETSAPVDVPEIPDFVLDEAFVWSAEVLAAQGRRPDQVSLEEITWLKRLRQGLDKTRRSLVNQLRAIVGQGPLNQDAVMEIESLLLQADVGIEATDYIIESLQTKLRQETLPPQEAIAYLKQLLRQMLDKPLGDSHSLSFVPEKDKLNIWLITGVNGAGKTTTIGKIAHIAQKSGYRCLIAAADTFRAAAVQQVKVWGERSSVEVISNPGKNTDPAAVVFDGIAAAQARNTELLLVDTAGRLQNKKNLMDELSKIRRIIDKKAPDANVESLLVLDSTLGQNGLRQAEVFAEVAKLSGVVLTKLDGTAKGGIALAVVQQLGLPIRFIGAGEGIEDLRPFSSYEFVEALLSG